MINLETASVTTIQFFDNNDKQQIGDYEWENDEAYQANIVLDEYVVIQLSGNKHLAHRATIPQSWECYYNDEDAQDWAHDYLDIDDVEKFLEKEGIANNRHYLYENATDKLEWLSSSHKL